MSINEQVFRKFYESYWGRPRESLLEGDSTNEERTRLLFDAIQSTYGPSRPLKVLDAGCGTGFFTEKLASWGHEAYGVDISTTAVTKAKELHPDLSVEVCPLEGPLPFDDSFFDLIFSSEVIEHVFGVYEMLQELNRVLKPGGFLILTTPYHGFIKNLLIVIFNFDRHFNGIESGHIRFFTIKSLKNILRKCGFFVKRITLFGRPINFLAKGMFTVAIKI